MPMPLYLFFIDLQITNNDTDYWLYGNLSVKNNDGNRHISKCVNLAGFSNTKIVKKNSLDMKKLRDKDLRKDTNCSVNFGSGLSKIHHI